MLVRTRMFGKNFSDSLRAFFKSYNIRFSYFKPLLGRSLHVSDKINEETIERWNNSNPVFISAQTGTGKNYFIQKMLIRKLDRDNKKNDEHKKILILSNRVALTEQTKLLLEKKLIDVTIENWQKIVKVCSYHEFLNFISNLKYKKLEKLKEKIKYVVMDECHFFLSDAEFNPRTFKMLQTILSTFKNSVRIYLSATLEEVFFPILELESKYYYRWLGHNPDDEPENFDVPNEQKWIHQFLHMPAYDKFSCYYYYFKRDYRYIEKIYEYDDIEILTENIVKKLNENPQERWLIFVLSRKVGENLKNELSDKKISCVFLTADSKNANDKNEEYSTYREIVENEQFSPQVLISTSVLDNGINIKGSSVKNVIIDAFDRTEMIQMLGRVRIEGSQKINLYLRNYSEHDIEKFIKKDIRKLTLRLNTDFVKEKRHKYYDKLLSESGYQYKMEQMFYHTDNKNRVFDYNKYAVYRLINRLTDFIEMMSIIKNKEYYIDPKDFGDKIRRQRVKIFGNYQCGNVERYCDYWINKICRILATEEDKKESPPTQSLYFTFQAYLDLIKLTDRRSSFSIAKQNRIMEKEVAKKNFLSLLKQIEWLEIDFWRFKRLLYSPLQSSPKLPDITEELIVKILKDVSISNEEYLKYSNNEEKHQSAGKCYVSFKEKSILAEKGIPKAKLKNALNSDNFDEKDSDMTNLANFVKIFNWLKQKIKLQDPSVKNVLQEIVKYFDENTVSIGTESYCVKIVRGTGRKDRSEDTMKDEVESEEKVTGKIDNKVFAGQTDYVIIVKNGQ